LRALPGVADGRLRREIAIALVTVLPTRDSIEELATLAGAGNPQGFVVDAIARLAAYDPERAILEAATLSDYALQTESFERIAGEWAIRDPEAALSRLAGIGNPLLRNRYHAAIVSSWSSSDPDAALEYVASTEGRKLMSILPTDMAIAIAEKLLIDRPEELLAAANEFGGTAAGPRIALAARSQLTERDLPAALGQLETFPSGSVEYQRLVASIALAYARQDPTRAFEWAKGLELAVAGGLLVARNNHL
jgi:hypothetical protein